jgi:hypothetical protein
MAILRKQSLVNAPSLKPVRSSGSYRDALVAGLLLGVVLHAGAAFVAMVLRTADLVKFADLDWTIFMAWLRDPVRAAIAVAVCAVFFVLLAWQLHRRD